MRRSILKDTLLLTAMQMALDAAGIWVNVRLNRTLGTASVGVLTLSASVFRLICTLGSGNAFLCVSRFVSEELGKKNRDPAGILRLCMMCALGLSVLCCGILYAFSGKLCTLLLHDPTLSDALRHLGYTLPLITLAACLKGWYNALCKAGTCAVADGVEFLLRTGTLLVGAAWFLPKTAAALCDLTAVSNAVSAGGALLFLALRLPGTLPPKTGRKSLAFGQYLKLAIPVMGGSALTALLSAANDALVPVTLRQSGTSAEEALSQFGIFESIILPTLFFPSTILCALAGILVTEMAREHAADSRERICDLTDKTIRRTLWFAIFVTALLLTLGEGLGELLGGGETAGRMICLLSPVVPFIYLEIVLESILKGLGAQGFSSLNYLCEYLIRITIVVVCIPLMGFTGLVLSYYASNIVGNSARLIAVLRKTGLRFRVSSMVLTPCLAAVTCVVLAKAVFRLMQLPIDKGVPGMVLFAMLCTAGFGLCAKHLEMAEKCA